MIVFLLAILLLCLSFVIWRNLRCAPVRLRACVLGDRHIYMTSDGRISLAGLPSSKAEYLAKAIDDCVRNH